MTRVLVPSGVLGLGFDGPALMRGAAMQPDIIAIDGGSTDSGPFYLGTGTSKYGRAASKSEWRQILQARAQAGVPLVIGSCGTCGTDSTVDWMYQITVELAMELGQNLKIARLYSSQSIADLQVALADGRITALAPELPLDADILASCSNIVALAGAEQINAALATGADIVLAGRTTDTASIAAMPLARGDHAGAVWHGAKVAECGALCSTNPTSGVIVVDFDGKGFEVEPPATGAACTPHSVSAHMLYENSDPFILYEPGGHLDVRAARYKAKSAARVRAEGAEWVVGPRYTVKLEGARLAGHQTTILALLRDPHYVRNAQAWADKLQAFLESRIAERMGLGAEDYTIEFRLIGANATLGALENRVAEPVEIGVLGIITARDAAMADEIGRMINPFVLHYPLREDEELPTFAFPYSPAQSDRGAMYEFCLNHILTLDNPMDAFRLVVDEVGP